MRASLDSVVCSLPRSTRDFCDFSIVPFFEALLALWEGFVQNRQHVACIWLGPGTFIFSCYSVHHSRLAHCCSAWELIKGAQLAGFLFFKVWSKFLYPIGGWPGLKRSIMRPVSFKIIPPSFLDSQGAVHWIGYVETKWAPSTEVVQHFRQLDIFKLQIVLTAEPGICL